MDLLLQLYKIISKSGAEEQMKSFVLDNLKDVAEEVNDLLVSKKRKKRLQTIIKQIEPMYVFYLFEYKPPKNIRKHAKDNADEIATFCKICKR